MICFLKFPQEIPGITCSPSDIHIKLDSPKIFNIRILGFRFLYLKVKGINRWTCQQRVIFGLVLFSILCINTKFVSFINTQKIDIEFGRILRKTYESRRSGDYDVFVEFSKIHEVRKVSTCHLFRTFTFLFGSAPSFRHSNSHLCIVPPNHSYVHIHKTFK